MTMIERVAKAIDEPTGLSYSPTRPTDMWEWLEGTIDDDEPSTVTDADRVVFSGTFLECKAEYQSLSSLRRARAAIEAMLKPTKRMLKAGNDTGMFIASDEDTHENDREPEAVWVAMIGAALKEGS